MKKELLLVDGSGYIFRTHYAMIHIGLTSQDGESTHIIMGVLNMIDRLQKQYPNGDIVMVLDGKGKGIRATWSKEYKANRPTTPPEIKAQIPPLKEIIMARGIPLVVQDETEADDMIATITEQAKNSYEKIIIASGDKDLAQLVEDDKVVMLYDDKKNLLFDAKAVEEKWNVPPQLIPDYLSLIGDKVDNIPGVEKVGPKTAANWLKDYGSLQGIIDNSAKIGGKVGDNLRDALDHLPLSLKMNSLIRDIELPISLAEIEILLGKKEGEREDKEELKKLYIKYGLSRLLHSLDQGEDDAAREIIMEIITSPDTWQQLCAELTKADNFCLMPISSGANDKEHPIMSNLQMSRARIVGMAFAYATNESDTKNGKQGTSYKSYYLPLSHDYISSDEYIKQLLKIDSIKQDLEKLLSSPKSNVIFHDVKNAGHLLDNHGISLPIPANNKLDDIMLLSYLSNSALRHDIKSLSEGLLKKNLPSIEDLIGKGKSALSPAEVEIEKMAKHSSQYAISCLEIHQLLKSKIAQEKEVEQVYQEIELPLSIVLMEMERNGALLDTKILNQQSRKLEEQMGKLQQQAYKMAGEEFNLGSPMQLKEILYEKMKLSTDKKTGTGQLSTAEDALQELVAQGEKFPEIILEYRGLSKLKNTYTDTLPQLINESSGRVHSSFNQAVASTGRLSSANPNLQNIPIRDEEGRNVRAAFIPEKGMTLASADYSQIELRIMAHLSEDKSLLDAFAKGQDVHKTTASEIFDVPIDEVDREQRRRAKIANFGLIYGMGPFGLARQLYISNKEAQDFIALYFSRYPGVKRYMDEIRVKAEKDGFAETLSGRRVYLPQINSNNFAAKQAAVRAAINAPVQGTAADLIKLAMLKIQPQMKAGEAQMIMQVHDELVFEIKEDLLAKYQKIICQSMEAVQPLQMKLKVPLEADFGHGKNWKDAH